jgi:hypothetical protein
MINRLRQYLFDANNYPVWKRIAQIEADLAILKNRVDIWQATPPNPDIIGMEVQNFSCSWQGHYFITYFTQSGVNVGTIEVTTLNINSVRHIRLTNRFTVLADIPFFPSSQQFVTLNISDTKIWAVNPFNANEKSIEVLNGMVGVARVEIQSI